MKNEVKPFLGRHGYFVEVCINDKHFFSDLEIANMLNITLENYIDILIHKYNAFSYKHTGIWFKNIEDCIGACELVESALTISKLVGGNDNNGE